MRVCYFIQFPFIQSHAGFNGIEGSVGQRSIHFVASVKGEVVVGVISVRISMRQMTVILVSPSTVFQRGIR